jgi:hypothetical protein
MEKSNAKKPCTPARTRFLDLFKPSIVPGQYRRNASSDDMALADTANQARSSPVARTRLKRSASVALQNEDGDLEETIIVTALETIPFCCHEDLLTMTHHQLVAVVEALNAKLPAALRIDTKPSSTDSFIRNAIELIVGIKRTVPGAPKAVKLGLSSLADPDSSVSPLTSPLATKTQPRDVYQASRRLAVLKEEDEETATGVHERPVKKRKTSGQADNTVTKRRVSAQSAPPIRRTRSAASAASAHKPKLIRNRSQRIPISHISPPRSSRILRSHSQKLPSETKIDATFITMDRPRYRFRPKTISGAANTSTPPQGIFGNRDRDEEDSPDGKDQETLRTSASSATSEMSPSSTTTTSGGTTPHGNTVCARRDEETDSGSGDVDSGMIIGLHGMTMATSKTDMDVSF